MHFIDKTFSYSGHQKSTPADKTESSGCQPPDLSGNSRFYMCDINPCIILVLVTVQSNEYSG